MESGRESERVRERAIVVGREIARERARYIGSKREREGKRER